jgi:diguanylate cyclase (GGDEF)-like protein/PAS domain S-box-containing protein
MEYRQFAKDGRVVWVRDESTLVRDEGGGPLYWLGVQTDVTERKRTEAALRESEERFRRSFDDAATGMALVAPDGRWLRINRSLCEITGYPAEELLGKTFQDITHLQDLDKDLDNVRRMLSGEVRTYQMEKRYLHKEGHVVWVLLSVSLVRDEVGEPLYFVSQIRDVSERKRAEEALREAEERYRTLVEQIPAVTYVDPVDDPDNSLYTSPHIERMLGYTPEEWQNERLWPKRLHPNDRERVLAADERFEKGEEERFDEEYRMLAKDGSVVWVREEAVLVKGEEGKPLYWQGIMHDVTARREAEEALRHSEERYRNVVEEQTELVCRFSPDLILTLVNGAYCRYFGKGSEELLGTSFMDHIYEADPGYYKHQLVRLNPESPTATVEERVSTPDGMRWLQWTDTAIFDGESRIVEYQSVGRDVTERRRAEQRLEHQALHDPLTGLPNRRLFVDRLGQALRHTRRLGNQVAVLFMDLDEFKVVNDSLGHEAGDLLLTVVAQRLKRCLRPEDTLARFGGDEFVVLVEGVADATEAIQVSTRITDELRRPFLIEGRELFVAASIGIALGEDRTKSPENLLRDADNAMYRAKDEAAAYRVFDQGMYLRAVGRLELENDLRRAVERDEFVVHYQPIVHLQNGKIWGVEALVRWNHPERGLLKPSAFVGIMEESGLVVPMGRRVLEVACRQAKVWQTESPRTPPPTLSVNLSARQLGRTDLTKLVEDALSKTGFDGSCLTLDVTETAYVEVLEANTPALDRLRAMGVRISIDDFGTGYSSLAYLKRLPADALKIDKSFVRGIGEDTEDTALVRMIVELAHTFGMKVIAEGVETGKQAALLKEMGCDLAQGYLFSEPLPAQKAANLLSTVYDRDFPGGY